MLVLALLVLVFAVIVFWRIGDRADTPPVAVPSKPIGVSTLSHGDPPPSFRTERGWVPPEPDAGGRR
jgi:hypothetical protein